MKRYLLIIVIALAFLLRFWKLDVFPALNADEAAIGYNAYSLIKTGKDEHGNSWPIHFQSFNDYKPGLYFYVVLPFVKVLGLNEWAVRIPGALAGVLTILVVYFLVKELFSNENLALSSSFLLAINPWHIQFSRGGWEVNFATFLMTLGLLFFLKGLKHPKNFIASVIFFVLSLYTYHAERVIVPLLAIGFLIIYRKYIFNNIKYILLAAILGIVLLIPLAMDLTKPGALSRAQGVGLFADPGPLNRINEQRGEHGDFNGIIPKLFHNKAVNYSLAFLANWASHFHGEFLFLSGDSIQRNKVPETGQLYLFEIVTIAVALIFIARNFNKGWGIIFLWLAVAPIASALTFQAPNALRSQNMTIPLEVVSAYGLLTIISWIGRMKKAKVAGYILIGILVVWSLARYEHMYWVHMSKEYPFSSQYGVKELVTYIKSGVADRYQNVVVTDRYDQPYILFLFYLKYDPAKFQKDHTLTAKDQFGFSTVRSFDKYRFITFGKWESVRDNYKHSLIVGTPSEIPKEANIVKKIYGTNGYEYFDVVAN